MGSGLGLGTSFGVGWTTGVGLGVGGGLGLTTGAGFGGSGVCMAATRMTYATRASFWNVS